MSSSVASLLERCRVGLGMPVPKAYRAYHLRRQLCSSLLAGLIIRLLLMPFACHNDYLSEHWVAAKIAFGGDLYPSPDQWLSHYLDAAFMKMASPFVPQLRYLVPPPELGAALHASTIDFLSFAAAPWANRVIFVTKVPYLLAELAIVLVLLNIEAAQPEHGLRAVRWWLYNPIGIFALYIYGRHEAYALLFVTLAIWALTRNRARIAAVWLGLAAAARVTPAVLVPVLALLANARWPERACLVAISMATALSVPAFFQGALGWRATVVVSGDRELLPGMWNTFGSSYPVLVFFALYFAALILCDVYKLGAGQFVTLGAVVYLLMYAFTWQSVHYFCWVAPFATLALAERRIPPRMYLYFVVSWFMYWFAASDIGVFTLYLFSPLAGELCCLGTGGQLLSSLVKAVPLERLVLMLRTLLTATSVAMAIVLCSGARFGGEKRE